ncbi:MAG: acetyl-CoA carboxylase carboxyl transferase subunit alpha, partial [Planctomycetota bacterium]
DKLKKHGIIDRIIAEPLGGAHRDPHAAARGLEQYLAKTLRELKKVETPKLLDNRYAKFRALGAYEESAKQTAVAASA